MSLDKIVTGRKFIVIGIALLLASTAAGCLGGDTGGDDGDGAGPQLVIGSLVPLTGALEAYGPSGENAVALAVKEINAADGVNGKNVRQVKGDTGSTASEGATAAQNLVNTQGAQVVMGAYSSDVSTAVLEQLSGLETPMISPASTAPSFTTEDDGNWFFRTVPSDALQGTVMANHANEAGYETVNVIHVNNPYGQGFANVFKEEFDGVVAQTVPYQQEQGSGDYSTEVTQATTPAPDAVLFIGYPTGGEVIMQTAYEQGVIGPDSEIDWLFSEGVKSEEDFTKKMPTTDNGTNILAGYKGTTPQFGLAQNFVTKYKNEYNEDPALFADGAYDSAVIFALASEQCNCTGGQDLKDAMMSVVNEPGEKVNSPSQGLDLVRDGAEIDYEGNTGVDWTAEGDVPSGSYAIWQITGNGTIEIVQDDIQVGG